MKLKLLAMLCTFVILGCSEPSTPIDNAQQLSTESPTNEVIYPSADLDTPIAHVDINDDAGIIKSAGVKSYKVDTKGESDLRGEPYTSYDFDKKLGAGVQLSRQRVMVSWFKIENEADGFENSVKSLRVAQNISRALMGIEGAHMIDSVMAGNNNTATTINGVNVDRATCNSSMCLLVIIR